MSNSKEELKHRVEQRKHELKAQLEKFKAGVHGTQNEEINRIESKLSELDSLIEDGWDNISDAVTERLNAWLK